MTVAVLNAHPLKKMGRANVVKWSLSNRPEEADVAKADVTKGGRVGSEMLVRQDSVFPHNYPARENNRGRPVSTEQSATGGRRLAKRFR